MASERIPMGGDLIRHHVTNAPIAEDSMFYPIAEFLQSYSIPFSKHVLMLWIAGFITIIISLWATKSYSKYIKLPLLWRIPIIGEKFFIYKTNVQRTIKIPLLYKIPKIGKKIFTYQYLTQPENQELKK